MVTTLDEDGHLTATLEGSAAFEQLVTEVETYDQRHPIDRCLIEAGIRWDTLRHIAVPARCDLVRYVLDREPPTDTQRAVSPDAWIDAVTTRIQEQDGGEFKYRPKKRRWWRVANVLRACADWQGRPLTWVGQDEIAAAVGCHKRTVTRVVAWLRREGLLHEVLPGLEKLPRQRVPDDETEAEQADRHARTAAAVAAEEAAITRAHAAVDIEQHSLFTGATTPDADEALSPEQEAALAEADELEPGWVHLAPVYELRVPLSAAERAEEAAISRAHTKLANSPGDALAAHHSAELVPVRNADLYPALYAIGHDGNLTHMTGDDAAKSITCGKAVGLLRPNEFGYPPQVIPSKKLKSRPVQLVDKRPASPGSEETPRCRTQQSEAVRAAQWLLRSRLHPDLCPDVSVHFLAALIRSSKLLSAWGSSYGQASALMGLSEAETAVPSAWHELADLLHGIPDYAHLPRHIRNPRGWIKARFQGATSYLPPSKQKLIRHLEHGQAATEQRRTTAGAAKRAARDACPICDTEGWFHADPTDPTAPLVKCNHDPETGGW